MSLRRSPRLTPGSLAARRRNARKSTGPRTRDGKRRSAWNAFRWGWRTQVGVCCLPFGRSESSAYTALESALRHALGPARTERGTDFFNYTMAGIWKIKRTYDRWIEKLSDLDYVNLALGLSPLPHAWRLQIRRPHPPGPGWQVAISVSVRWGRSLSAVWDEDDEWNDEYLGAKWALRLHSLVCVNCAGDPYFNRRLALRTNLECH